MFLLGLGQLVVFLLDFMLEQVIELPVMHEEGQLRAVHSATYSVPLGAEGAADLDDFD